MQEKQKLEPVASHLPNRNRAIYKLEKNINLKFHLRRITQPDFQDEKCGVAPTDPKLVVKVEGTELQRMREACDMQFRHISNLIGRPFPNTTLFSQIEQIKIHTLHNEAAAETSAGSNPTPPSPQPTHLDHIEPTQRLRPPNVIHEPMLSPVLPEVEDLDCKHTYRPVSGRGMFEHEDELQFLIGEIPNNRYNDLSDFL